MAKAALIKTSTSTKTGEPGKWYKLNDDIIPFIMGIETGEILKEVNADVLNTLISGVPSPWARAKQFVFAFNYIQSQDPNISTSGLIQYYKLLVDEWKGLMAILAIYADRITFSSPVYMDESSYLEGNSITSSLGRMLFDDKDLWCDQEKLSKNKDEKPFIQLIYYKGILIGATSPFSIVFTGVDYSNLQNTSDIIWYRNGKFEDPTDQLSNDQLQKLYSFLTNITNNFEGFEKLLNSQRGDNHHINISKLNDYISNWKDLIKARGENLRDNVPAAKYYNLSMPFKSLLASEQTVYVLPNGTMTFIKPIADADYYILPDLQNLLLDSDTIIGWYESTDEAQPLHKAPIYYLQVTNSLSGVKGKFLYFALPLSIQGAKIFRTNLKTLLDGSDQRRFEAFVNEAGKLQVDLIVVVDREPVRLSTKEYKIIWEMGNKKVILWPNFTSDNWSAYFLYSEFPTNAANIKFIPFFKQKAKFTAKLTGYTKNGGVLETNIDEIVFGSSDKLDKDKVGLKAELIVKYPLGQVGDDVPAYEILESNKPIAGLQVKIDDKICGYMILKEGIDSVHDRSNDDSTLEKATVGIDFGSNNTCVYYSLNSNGSVFPVSFSNRRLALVGIDVIHDSVAQDNELLFFQNAEGVKGQIKSWLHEHHALAPVYKDSDDELKGGVPVNEKNIQIEKMDRYNIYTQAGKLHYNMKWLSDTSGRLKKASYLKTIWIQICADLYDGSLNRCYPETIRWSYPGALSEFDKDQYYLIFNNSLPEITPIIINNSKLRPKVDESMTESEAVCSYALNNRATGLTEEILYLGIDVGGSTSDILVLAKKFDGSKTVSKLIKQSSIRLAAGVFFDAIIKSSRFKFELFNFHENKSSELGFQVLGIGDLQDSSKKESAPFYLNNIFDQLKDEDFSKFYQFLAAKGQFVFTIPAYVTGLLTFYAGMLVANAIKDEGLTAIKEIDFLSFGKGGRLFFWLDTYPGINKSRPYLETCFKHGFGDGAENLHFKTIDAVRKDNKSEVAIGLVSPKINNLEPIDKSLRKNSDIFGERNIQILIDGQYKTFNEDDVLHSEYFAAPGNIRYPAEFVRFNDFLKIYLDFVGVKTEMVANTISLKDQAKNLKPLLTAYLETDLEWRKADAQRNGGKEFDYRFPFFIAEGMCYLEQVLIPEVFKI
jgi:hypothetical protein